MSRKGWAAVGAVVAVLLVPLVHQLFWTAPVRAEIPYQDDFDRAELGPDYWYFTKYAPPRLVDGRLHVDAVQNNPVWLEAKLPDHVEISFDVRSTASKGDIKFEAFGNGRDHESGYVFILGGWSNTVSVLARQDEHGRDRKERRDLRVVPRRDYHMRVVRDAKGVHWYVDGALFLEWPGTPLTGRHHDRFGFSAWETPLEFDHLVIRPL